MDDKEIYNNELLDLYEKLEVELIALLIMKVQEINYSEFNQYEFKKLQKDEGRKIYNYTINEFNNINSKRNKALKNIYKDNVVDKINDYDKDFTIDKQQMKIINENINLTNDNLRKLARGVANNIQDKMINSMGKMYESVVKGNESFQEAFKRVTKEITDSGLTYTDKAGRNRSIEATVRQDLLYRINETNRQLYKEVAKKMHTTGWQISITPNCRDSHQVINGQKFTNEEWKEYEHLTHDYNCQHDVEPIFYEFQENRYTQEEIDYANNRTVKYKGEDISYYDATQKQRALERAIRNAKKNVVIAEKTKIDIDQARTILEKADMKMQMFIKETKLYRDEDREFYALYD